MVRLSPIYKIFMLSFFLAFYNQIGIIFYINTIITPEDQSALFIYRSQT